MNKPYNKDVVYSVNEIVETNKGRKGYIAKIEKLNYLPRHMIVFDDYDAPRFKWLGKTKIRKIGL